MNSVGSCVLALMVSVSAAGCAKRCEPSVDGISLSETFSFDLLRPMTATERTADASVTIELIQVFEDRNEHWDMDAACRFKSLPMRTEFRDANGIAQFMDAVRDDVIGQAASDVLADCRPSETLYHVFLYHHEPREIGYLLIRPCVADGQVDEGMMTSYSADGDVSISSGARTVRVIKTR